MDPAIILALGIYTSLLTILHSTFGIIYFVKEIRNPGRYFGTVGGIVSSVLWGIFYYLTH